jgi:hypothetical protein
MNPQPQRVHVQLLLLLLHLWVAGQQQSLLL